MSHLPDDAPRPQPPDDVEAVAAQFLTQLQAGENPDRQALLHTHSHLGSRLEQRLALVEMAYRVGLAPQDERPGPGETVEAPGPGSDPGANPAPTVAAAAADSRQRRADLPDYELLSELGQGGMGVVYQARHKRLNRLVALKMLRAGAHASPELLARFHIEAEALASLQHPNIVQVYEVGQHDGCPFIAMEFLDGGSLADYLAGQPQPPRAAAELVETLARAVHAAHLRGIVHRDLKPANVLLGRTAARSQGLPPSQKGGPGDAEAASLLAWATPKITDFGLAKRLAEGKGRTSTGVIMGTPSYMAPEQASGRVRAIGPAADVYALGALLYEVLTGQPPFQGESGIDTLNRVLSEEPPPPSRLRPKLPRDLETICLKCLEKEPGKRYATAEELADDLRRFLAGEPTAARPAGVGERAWKWTKRRPALAALLGVSAAAAVLLAGSLTWSYARVLAERDRARANLQVARRAIDELYIKMASERLFDEPQLDPLCQELLEKARTLYEELAREQGGDADVRRASALAWFRLGDIHRLRDQHDPAEQAYGEAIARQEELHRAHPEEPGYRQDLANSHNWLGELLRERGRPADEAERHYRAALELQHQLVQQFPCEPAYRMELARSHYNLGIVGKDTNQLPEARADYDRAVDLLTELHQDDPAEPNVRQDLARACINRGVLHRLGGRPREAGRDYDRAIALLARLRNEFPARAAYKFELAIARQDRGNLLWSQGQHGKAQGEQQQALTLLRGLVADFSSRPRYKKKLGNALKNLGTALASAGDRAGAEQCWNQARDLFEALAKNDPETAAYHALLGMTLGNLGWLRTEQKHWPEARRLIEQGIAQVQAALKPNPQQPDYLQELRSQYQDLAETLVQLGDHAAAAEAAANLAGVYPHRPQEGYYAACFVARSVALARQDEKVGDAEARQALARRYVEQAVALLRGAVARAAPDLKRLPDEKEVFRPLEAHRGFGEVLRELDAKTRPGPGKGVP